MLYTFAATHRPLALQYPRSTFINHVLKNTELGGGAWAPEKCSQLSEHSHSACSIASLVEIQQWMCSICNIAMM
jgi:hypothetical protein